MEDYSIEQLEELLQKKKQKELVFKDIDAKGRPRITFDNSENLFNFYSIRIRHNEMTKNIDIDIPNQYFSSDTELNAKLAYLKTLARKHDLPPADLLEHVTLIANNHSYHPVRDWIDACAWDGVSRLQAYYDTFEIDYSVYEDETVYSRLKDTMMRKWALAAVAALYAPNFSCEGVLCLYGRQAAGKTTWIQSLLPPDKQNIWFKDGVTLDIKNKDSVLKVLGAWISELGEIDSTFKVSDIEQLKGFITEKIDVLRPPYERAANRYSRRTVMLGSMNRREFLSDTENRRFWPINVIRVHPIDQETFDIQQFWAEIKVMYQQVSALSATPKLRQRNNEYGWFLSPQERQELQQIQRVFKTLNPTEQLLENRVVTTLSGTAMAEWMNCTAILMACGRSNPSRADANITANWCREQGLDYKKDTKQFRVWIPPIADLTGLGHGQGLKYHPEKD